ncbi:hypothetical protein H8S95_09385 [Pontibacter sp. KCTC 32443]|uniref:hypothetical protein n=1 Tax=Pontibacter TaxID=323449 RepID=UPI00164E7C06|nr:MULTISPECIES: hypothetical protein [Pontibacter]MBC5774272.1 hypothetical protein [Pontibacter sp. KCTC 32443]
MRHEQDNNRNYRDRDRYHERRDRGPEHEQNAQNRWGEPDPRMGPHADDWQRSEDERSRQGNYNRSDWRPFEQRDNRHFQDDDRRYGDYRNERPEFPQDRRFREGDQHAEDRWSSENEMSHRHQHHHPRHTSERFFREERRRNR